MAGHARALDPTEAGTGTGSECGSGSCGQGCASGSDTGREGCTHPRPGRQDCARHRPEGGRARTDRRPEGGRARSRAGQTASACAGAGAGQGSGGARDQVDRAGTTGAADTSAGRKGSATDSTSCRRDQASSGDADQARVRRTR